MTNVLFSPEEYILMYKDTKVGTFTVDCDPDGNYIYTVDVQEEFINTYDEPLWEFTDGDGAFISKERDFKWHTIITQMWVDSRVFPKERMFADKLLDTIGLTEYDQLAILKYTSGKSINDDFWIKFQ